MVRRLRVHELQKCATALEQVSLERILCSENLAVDMDDNERSRSSRMTWMESFYYSSYDRKRLKLISDELRDEEEAGGLRRVFVDIERPTRRDQLEWKHKILQEHPAGQFRDMMSNIELCTIRTSDFCNENEGSLGSSSTKSNSKNGSLSIVKPPFSAQKKRRGTQPELLTTRRVEILTMYLTVNWANLLELSLPNCNIDADRISLLSEGIAINDSIRVANFSSNRIGNAGATAVARALRMNSSIIKLDLSRNRIGDEGASQIAGVMGPYYLDVKSSERRVQMAARKDARRRERQLLSLAVSRALMARAADSSSERAKRLMPSD